VVRRGQREEDAEDHARDDEPDADHAGPRPGARGEAAVEVEPREHRAHVEQRRVVGQIPHRRPREREDGDQEARGDGEPRQLELGERRVLVVAPLPRHHRGDQDEPQKRRPDHQPGDPLDEKTLGPL
jgi:hypothetical protein